MSIALIAQELAIYGGQPIRSNMLPYGRHVIEEDDIQAVIETLRSDWLTTGPKIAEFEEAVAKFVGTKYAVSFSSGTAALHAAAFAAGLAPGDEAVTTPFTFAATANAILYQGATPVFADIEPEALNIDPEQVPRRISARTKAILPVDYAGHPVSLDEIVRVAERHGLIVIEDACHALGAVYKNHRIGSLAHMTVFSFHPVKHVACGEGGMVATDNPRFAQTLRRFRNHGIDNEARERQAGNRWFYEMVLLGFNYRLSDIACALGLTQLAKLEANLARRRQIAAAYGEALQGVTGIRLPVERSEVSSAWHLYPIRLHLNKLSADREQVFRALRAENIGVNVHYIPVHLHPYYRDRFGYAGGEFPVAEDAYAGLISLPMFHGMSDRDVQDVIAAVQKVITFFSR